MNIYILGIRHSIKIRDDWLQVNVCASLDHKYLYSELWPCHVAARS